MPSATTDLIRKIDFFEPLEEKIIRKIADVCIPREYSKGDAIVKQGESGLGLFFITAGKVHVEVERNGRTSIVATLKEEDFLGELSIIDNKPRSANVVCIEDTSCLLLTRDSFSRLMNKYPEIAVQMAKALAGRIRAANEKMTQSGGVPVQEAATGIPPAGGTASPPDSISGQDAAPPPADTESSAKEKLRDYLVETFSFLYTMKALTRFSAAIVGCPVTLGCRAACATVDEAAGVKIAMFPSDKPATLEIDAWADGPFSATVLRPPVAGPGPRVDRFDGRVVRDERIVLDVPPLGAARLCPSNAGSP